MVQNPFEHVHHAKMAVSSSVNDKLIRQIDQLNAKTCISKWLFAVRTAHPFGYNDLLHACLNMFAANVGKIRSRDDLLNLSGANMTLLMESMTMKPWKTACNADDLCLAAVDWVQHDIAGRKSFAKSMAKLIPFTQVSRDVLLEAGRIKEFKATVKSILDESKKRKVVDSSDEEDEAGSGKLPDKKAMREKSPMNKRFGKKQALQAAHSSNTSTDGGLSETSAPARPTRGRRLPQLRTCTICSDEKRWSAFYGLNKCGHSYRTECLQTLIRIKVEEGSVKSVKCPDPDCQQPIDYDDVKKLVPADVFEKFDKLLLELEVAAMDDVEICSNKACDMQYVVDAVKLSDSGHTTAECPHCQSVLCLMCKGNFRNKDRAPHVCALNGDRVEKVLDEYESNSTSAAKRIKLEKIYGKQKLRNLCDNRRSQREVDGKKKCPQCKAPCVKEGGCNKMTCSKCNTVWCWLCGSKIPVKGYEHFNVASGSRQDRCAGKLWQDNNKKDVSRAAVRAAADSDDDSEDDGVGVNRVRTGLDMSDDSEDDD